MKKAITLSLLFSCILSVASSQRVITLDEQIAKLQQNDVEQQAMMESMKWIQQVGERVTSEVAASLIEQQKQGRRSLNDGPLPLDVGATCRSYNTNAAANLDCRCRRSGRLDVYASCSIGDNRCTTDGSICWIQRFTTILDGAAALSDGGAVPANRMTTCTTRVANAALNETSLGEVCVEVQPRNYPGFFNETVICGASLNGQLCRACYGCNKVDDGRQHVTIDCCNVKTDAKATCMLVEPNTGIVLPVFDVPGTHKNCVESGAVRMNGMTTTTTVMVAMAAATFMVTIMAM